MDSSEVVLYEPKAGEDSFLRVLMLAIALIMIVSSAIEKEFIAGLIEVGAALIGIRPFGDTRKISIRDGRLVYRLGWSDEKDFKIEDVEKLKITFSLQEEKFGVVKVNHTAKFAPEPPFIRLFQAGRKGVTVWPLNRALNGRNKECAPPKL
jgi:hypothetical protein